jgi:ABC-type branched-subunit amino acid transport system substrate-binding protein
MAEYAVTKLGKKRIAFIYQNDDFGREGHYGIGSALRKYG